MKRLTLHPLIAWLVGFTIAVAVCYWPGGLALFVVAMWGGFSPSVSMVSKALVLAVTLIAILAAVFFLARSIAKALIGK